MEALVFGKIKVHMGAIQNGGEFPTASVQLHRLRARRPRSQ